MTGIERAMGRGMVMLAALAVLAPATVAAEPPAAEGKPEAKAENPLAALPSKAEGEHIEKIKALGDNSWAILGQAAADPKWGVARGRSWCSKMAAAPDLGGAFFCGTGQHGYVKPDGHYMDDLFFYDANAHKWICLYPGADTKTLRLHLDKNGLEVNEQGDPIPVSYLSHAYCNTTYNTDLRLYHVQWLACPWWGKALPQRYDWLDVPVEKRTYGNAGPVIMSAKHPLLWDVAKGKWDRKFVEGPGPGTSAQFQGVAEYIPSLKKTLCFNHGIWLYDYATNTWTLSALKAPDSVRGGYDCHACYDPRRERLYMAVHKGFGYMDVAGQKWHDVQAEGQPADLGCTNDSQMYFDTANGVVLWHQSHGPIAIYDPEANKWTNLGDTLPLAQIPWKNCSPKAMCFSGFYNAALNVHCFYLAGDSSFTDATLLAYRYKNVTK